MSSKNIGMFYSVTAKPNYQQLSKPKNKPVHPYIMKMMENAPKPIVSKDIKSLAMMNTSKNLMKKSAAKAQVHEKPDNSKNFVFSSPQTHQNINPFSMNFSQLSTGKPCGSCGGR
jgi:hypothetical protein